MVVFEKTGRENTDAALHIAIEAAVSRGYGIVAASNTGETVDRLLTLMAEAGASVPVVMVGQVDGFAAPGKNALSPEMRRSLKARGVRIAVLYTEYLPESLTGDDWSQTNIAPYLYKVEPALQACSSPGLYTKVSTDQDISAAMAALFQNAVATARITQ